MLSLLALLSAGSAPAAGFAGGALVGAQAGYSYINLKRLAKDKATTKAQADAAVGVIAAVVDASFTADANAATKYDAATDTLTVRIEKGDDAAAAVQKVTDAVSGYAKTVKVLNVVVANAVLNADTKIGDTAADAAVAFKAAFAKSKSEDVSKTFVNAEAEGKYTSNNGFAGVHAGYLGRVNDKFLVGGLVEGNWVFGKDLKLDLDDKEVKDTSARFNVNAYLRAMFNLTDKFLAGVDLGVAGQEIRKLKEAGKTDKESKWFWGPAARLVLGVSLTDNILATAHFGGVFPVKQDHFDKDFKAKYTNFTGGVGISYAFGA